MAVPVIAASSADSTGNTNVELTISFPTGTVSGSLLLLFVTQYNSGADPAFGTITDWTKLQESIQLSGSNRSGTALYWRFADGVATNVTTITSPNSTAFGLCGKILRITGAHATTPIHLSSSSSPDVTIGAGDPMTLTGLTTTENDCLAIFLAGTAGVSVVTHTWTVATEQGDFGTDPGGAANLTWATKSMAVAGATGNPTVEPSGSCSGTGVAVAIAPPPADVSVTVGLAEETDSAFVITVEQATEVVLGLAEETDTALVLSVEVGSIIRPLVQPQGGPGCGQWTAYIVGRGGSPTRFELDFSSISVTRNLNASGTARVSIRNSGRAGSSCCEVFEGTEPWRDELLLYRNNELAYVGPIQSLSASLDGGTIASIDLFAWMEQRFLEEDFHGDGDVADIFRAVFEQAYDKDTSPNISISTRPTGIDAVRDFRGVEFKRAADVLRELARTALDFTMVGRRLLAGGVEVFLSTEELIVHDEGCISAEVSREGGNFATDVSVFGDTPEAGGTPITGRAIRSTSVYGLIQRTFTELTIRDELSADANALARLEAMQPAPLRVRAVLSQEAAFSYSDAIPGRRADVRLREAAGCIEVDDVMRLQQLTADVQISENGPQETISADLIPLGVSEV